MIKLVGLTALPQYRLRLRYADGAEGEVDLSEFAGRGVFKLWDRSGAFEGVWIGEFGQVAWSDEVELCGDALYLRLTAKRPEEIFP